MTVIDMSRLLSQRARPDAVRFRGQRSRTARAARNRFIRKEYDVELAWFRKPNGDDDGTLNLTYNILDLPVIRGRAGDTAVTGTTELDFARLLEQVGALAGAFRGLGVTPGQQVAVRLGDPLRELIALLATLRIGATFVVIESDSDLGGDLLGNASRSAPALLVTDSLTGFGDMLPEAVIVSGIEPQDPTRDVAWEVVLKAGRTDPAGCEPVTPGATAYVAETPVRTIDAPTDPSRIGAILATLLAGDAVHLDAPRADDRAQFDNDGDAR
ncbi:hypothetical protein ASG90_06050 [Nocardioides sp. Soil797]|nr:hypothetical protein ASG90_06050 [Nocardioides sp. Soil797]